MGLFSVVTGSSLLVFTLILCSCGGPRTTNLAPRPTKEIVKASPDWFLKPPTDSEHLFATASATSRDMQLALQKARTTGQTLLAQQLGTQLANLTRQFQEEIGLDENSELLTQFSSATKAVTNETPRRRSRRPTEAHPRKKDLSGICADESADWGGKSTVDGQDHSQSESLHRFRATEAFDALNAELEALEAQEQR